MKLKPLKSEVFSPIKWQREQKFLKLARRDAQRAALPVLNREEIIAYRLPFHEAVIRRLDKNGYVHAAEYIRQLIKFQDEYRNASGEGSIIWQRPGLVSQHDILEHLANSLQAAEKAHFADRIDQEIDIILKLAIEYCFGQENWWWLGHQLLFITLESCRNYHADRKKRQAMARYVFGKFLFQKVNEQDLALEHLKIARKYSVGMSWNVNYLFPEESNAIHAETCILIFRIQLNRAKAVLQRDPKMAMRFSEKAKKRAMEGCFYEGIIRAYLLKGTCEMMLFDTDNALKSYEKGLQLLGNHPNIDLKCEILRNLAIAYLKHGALVSALNTLNQLKDHALRHGKILYVAQAHKYLGEFYLKEGTARNATPLLMTAIKLFDKAGDTAEIAKTRNLAAISVGIEMMPIFSNLVRDSDRKFSVNYADILGRLIRWKDSRATFWMMTDVSELTSLSVHTINTLGVNDRGAEELLPVDESIDVEELLGITGLDGESTFKTSEKSPSNITETISVPGVEFSTNTILPPEVSIPGTGNYKEEERNTQITSLIDKKTSSLTEYFTTEKEGKDSFVSSLPLDLMDEKQVR